MPPAPTQSAPAAPAAAPPPPPPAAKPSTPAPPPAKEVGKLPPPTTTPPVQKEDAFSDAFADLDEIDKGKKGVEPRKSAKPKVLEKPEKSEKNGEPTPDDDLDVPEEDVQPEGLTPEGLPKKPSESKPSKAATLRQAYEGLKEKVAKEYQPELETLRAKVKEFEERPLEDAAKVNQRVQELEKRNGELEQHIKFVDYAKSQDYQDKFWRPYVQAWENARRELKGLQVEYEDRESGDTKTRDLADADLQYLASLEPVQRRAEINRLFPNDKEEVKRHITEIVRLSEASEHALAEAQKTASEHSKQSETQRALEHQAKAKLWKEINDTLGTKYPAWFKAVEGDEEGNKLLSRGTALANLIFSPGDLKPEDIDLLPRAFSETIQAKKPFSAEQLTHLHAIAYNKFRNHDRLAFQLKQTKSRVSELEEELKQYQESSPDDIRPGKSPDKPWLEDADSELDAIDKKHR